MLNEVVWGVKRAHAHQQNQEFHNRVKIRKKIHLCVSLFHRLGEVTSIWLSINTLGSNNGAFLSAGKHPKNMIDRRRLDSNHLQPLVSTFISSQILLFLSNISHSLIPRFRKVRLDSFFLKTFLLLLLFISYLLSWFQSWLHPLIIGLLS